MEYKISVNQMADFSKSSEAKKRSIIRQQKKPSTFKVAWYQLARARFKKSIAMNGDLEPIFQGIEELIARNPQKQRQVTDRVVSLEAMQRFIVLKLPSLIKVPSEIIKKVDSKSIIINGVEVIVSPDVIFKIKLDGKYYLGAVKIHISKNNIFNNKQSRYVSSSIYKYLKEVVAEEDCEVLPELCLSIDVFGERVISVPNNLEKCISEIEVLCEEIKSIWNAAS
ncbi:hypothetical protein [Aquimarina sp. MMG016]|uniref:hypothetical protein n=1 Tax=Aquimarina sp. MMG016 TaxID=2822690 RepID=UPI001B3A30AB|nr:hypothetical protein [Aquimarina sp. MMG016]MBQ4818830.1 hypothetical protein [Aquimarina sp. MMG016]